MFGVDKPYCIGDSKSVVLKIEKLVTETYYSDGSMETETKMVGAMLEDETVIHLDR